MKRIRPGQLHVRIGGGGTDGDQRRQSEALVLREHGDIGVIDLRP